MDSNRGSEDHPERILRVLIYPFALLLAWLWKRSLDTGPDAKAEAAADRSAEIDDWSEAKKNDDWH